MSTMSERDYVRDFINDRCIARVPPGSKELPAHPNTGGFYTWQFCLREATLTPRVLAAIVADFIPRYEEPLRAGRVQLCGVESASTPLITAFVLACAARGWNVNAFSIRKDRKGYGRRNWIEGRALPNVPAMLVDDIVSGSHATALHGAKVLADHGLPIADHAYAVVFKTEDRARETIRLHGHDVRVGAMFRLPDFDLELSEYAMRGKLKLGKIFDEGA